MSFGGWSCWQRLISTHVCLVENIRIIVIIIIILNVLYYSALSECFIQTLSANKKATPFYYWAVSALITDQRSALCRASQPTAISKIT